MSRSERLSCRMFGGLLLAVLLAAPLDARQAGSVTGVVTDASTRRPLNGVVIQVPNTTISTVTRPDGRYLLTNVPAGEVTLRANFLGYGEGVQTVNVVAGQTTTHNFELTAQAIGLREIVVTGTAGETERRAMGTVVATVNAVEVTERTHIASVDQLLQNRVPGMMVYPPSGTHGIGQVMQLRGLASLSLDADPVIFIDGVRVDGSHDRQGVWLGGQHTSRIQDLQPQDIERVEIVKGAAAATLYGTQGSNGVIQIFTKRGNTGRPQWTVEISQGFERMRTDTFPGRLFSQFEGPDGFRALDPIREVQRGHHQNYSLAVGGGSDAVRYYVSGGFRRGEASIRPETNWERQGSGRANLDAMLSPTLTVSLNTAVISAQARIPRGENAWESIYQSFAAGIPYTATERRPYGEPGGSIDAHVQMEHEQATRRSTTGVTLAHSPGERFRHRATIGLDWFAEETTTFFPFGYEGMFYPLGNKLNHTRQFRDATVDYRATFEQPFSDAVHLRLSAGTQGNFSETNRVEAWGDQFPGPGLSTVAAAAITSAGEWRVQEINAGVFVDQTLELWDRLFVGAGLRFDGNSAFGDEFRYQAYPKASVAYNISDHAFWPGHLIGEMKLRAAYGESGRAPAQFAADRTYYPVSAKMGLPAVTPGNLGDPNLGPERSQEFEVGFDAALLNNRVGVELTAYRQRTVDALVNMNFPPSQGFLTSQAVNLGEVSNRGVEVLVNTLPVRTPNVEWNLTFQLAHQVNKLVSMGGLPPRNVRDTRLVEGFPINGVWSWEVTWNPELGYHEYSDSMVYVGPSDPIWTGGLNSSVRVGRFTLAGNAGFAAGHHRIHFAQWWDTYTGTGDMYLSLLERPHGGETFASDSLWDYAVQGGYNIFNYPGDFIRIRELSVGYDLPDRFAGMLGANRMSIRLSGRNLRSWSKFPGMDPEVGYNGAYSVGRGLDWNSTPMPRLYMLTVRTSF
jgi:TonB-dependent starch-binding outer membrane protein SusC